MRRQAIGLAFFLCVGVSATAFAQPTPAAAPSAAASAAPAATTAAPATGAPAVPIPAQADGATYSVRLRDLEARVDELKDQIRRSHTRLSLLADTILTGGPSGSRAAK